MSNTGFFDNICKLYGTGAQITAAACFLITSGTGKLLWSGEANISCYRKREFCCIIILHLLLTYFVFSRLHILKEPLLFTILHNAISFSESCTGAGFFPSFRHWFSHPFISRISCFPLWDFPALPLRFFPSLSPRGFSILPRGVFLFSPRFFRQSCNKKTPRIIRGVFALFTFSRTRSLGPDRRSSHRNPNRTCSSPTRKPRADR